MPIYIRDVGYIRSPGVNPHWSVTLGLEDLQGIMKGSVLLIEELDRYIAQRDRGEHPLPDIIGIANKCNDDNVVRSGDSNKNINCTNKAKAETTKVA